MKGLLLFILQFIIITPDSLSSNTKHILMFTFPGGKSHCFIFQELLRTTWRKLKKDRPEMTYKFHVLIHNYDIGLWNELSDSKDNFELYGFGSVELYDQKFVAAMDLAKENPIFGYNKFNEAMIFLNEEFLNSGILNEFKQLPFQFDLIITDVINMISPFIRRELNIKKQMYINPTCIYTWVVPNMEYNSAYEPVLGTDFSDDMTFFQRMVNIAISTGSYFMFNSFKKSQNKLFIERGYSELEPFQPDSLFMNQCVNGVHYPTSLPPNFIPAGAFLPRPPKILTDKQLNVFLSRYKENIYVSQGTITKAMKVEQLLGVFKAYPQIGFVFSIRKDMEIPTELPENVIGMNWVRQNDLLGDPRISAFVTHGGLNSILETIYHSKPAIVLGTSIDQVNSAALVKYRKYGIAFTSQYSMTKEALIEAIKEILGNKEYKENIVKASKIVQENDGKESFYYWLNYVIDHGYDHLIIDSILHKNWYQLFGIDILAVVIAFFGIFLMGTRTMIKNMRLKRKNGTLLRNN